MKEIEFHIPRDRDLARAGEVIEDVCAQRGLQPVLKGTLAKYPGSTHWHYKKEKQPGSLELTLYLPERRIWAKVQERRQAPWIQEELPHIRRGVEAGLKAARKK